MLTFSLTRHSFPCSFSSSESAVDFLEAEGSSVLGKVEVTDAPARLDVSKSTISVGFVAGA